MAADWPSGREQAAVGPVTISPGDSRIPPSLNGCASGPIVILTFGYSGVRSLTDILNAQPGLARTSGTGILPLCAEAVATWQRLEGTPAMSALAASSVKAMTVAMITYTLATAGRKRWCEIATAPASAAPFAELFPQSQFVCFYRSCPQVIFEVTRVARWGLAHAGMGDFAAMSAGNSVAAVAAYWLAKTRALLDFEAAHSHQSLRVRQEDLYANAALTTRSILQFLGLSEHGSCGPELPPVNRDVALAPGLPGDTTDVQIPVELIPGAMLAQINSLQATLGYPALRQG
jgi:Sulfotransferase family